MKLNKISVIIPRFNENYSEVNKAIDRISQYLKKRGIPFEIIISQNGPIPLVNLKRKGINILSEKKKGLGVAIKNGIKRAKGKYFYFLPIDVAFNFTDLDNMIPLAQKYDLLFGSKAHPQSMYKISLERLFLTKVQQFLVLIFLQDFPIRDPNGTYFGKLSRVKKIAPQIKSDDFFFGTELVSLAQKNNMRMKEVPVVYVKKGSRSTLNLLEDGMSFLKQLIQLSRTKNDINRKTFYNQ